MSENTYNNESNENIVSSENNDLGESINNAYESKQEVIAEDITIEVPSYEIKEKEREVSYLQPESGNYTEMKNEKVRKDKGGMRKKIASYIIVGAICSTLGGVASSIVTMNMMKNITTTNIPRTTNTVGSSGGKAQLITTRSTENLSIPEIVKKVSSSVVAISTKSATVSRGYGWQPTPQEGVGTGIIFSEDGYILTNYHVISGAQNIKVMLSDGKEVSAKVVNYDAAADVAVIKLEGSVKVPGVAEFGDSDMLEVGELAVAIGNPLGKEFLGSVTVGVISAINRQVSIENKDLKFIQTDAAINPGNSGGPLVNSKGQVIGINTAKIGQQGVEGLGFAIPINTVNPKMESLVKPILKIGISCRDITEDISKQYNIPVGVYISQVEEFSAAEKAGIVPGDIIIQFGDKKVKTVEEINKLKGMYKAGDIVKIELVRNGKTIKLDLILSE